MEAYQSAVDARAKFLGDRHSCGVGDCCGMARRVAKETGGRMVSGVFLFEGGWAYHAWVWLDGVLDATIDKFEDSDYNVRVQTRTRGVYYSPVDGDFLLDHYHEYADPSLEVAFQRVAEKHGFDIRRYLSDPAWFKPAKV